MVRLASTLSIPGAMALLFWDISPTCSRTAQISLKFTQRPNHLASMLPAMLGNSVWCTELFWFAWAYWISAEDFKLNDSIKNSISEAKKRHLAISKSLGFDVLEMQNYGKKLCKKHKVSPDAIMQLGFQVKGQ
jgi:Choline/Carnitine o-acyltransferase